jgi:hypothetical protein
VRSSSCRNDTPSPAATSTPAAKHVSTASRSSATRTASARVGTTATSWARSRAAAGSARIRFRTRSCTASGTAGPSAFRSSVTSSGFPPASRNTLSGTRPARRACSRTHDLDNGGSATRVTTCVGKAANVRRSGCSGPTSSSRKVTTNNAGSPAIRLPSWVNQSRVASSAQCTSSTTTSTGRGPGPDSSSRNAANTSSRGAPASSRAASGPRTRPADVVQRTQRAGRDELVARPPQHPGPPAEAPREVGDQRRLAHPRLGRHQRDPTRSGTGAQEPLEQIQRVGPLPQLHGADDKTAGRSQGLLKRVAAMPRGRRPTRRGPPSEGSPARCRGPA